MKKIIVLIALFTLALSTQAQFKRTVTDEGSYFKVATGLTDTILVDKSKILYVRQEGSLVSLVMFGYGGQNVSIRVDTSGWSSGSINQFVADLNTATRVFISDNLLTGTQKLVNSTFVVNSDSAFVYLSAYPASGNVNDVYYKGEYGVYLPLYEDQVMTWGDRIKIIPELTILSTAGTDTVYIITMKK